MANDGLFKRPDSPFWYCSIVDADGVMRPKSTRCRDREAARLARKELEKRAADPTYRAAHETTLAEYITRFMEERRSRGKAPGTLKMYDEKSRHLARLMPSTLAQITALVVDDYITKRRNEGASASTIHKELVTLRGVLRLAVRHEKFAADPRAVLPIGFSTEYEPRKHFLTTEQVDALIRALPKHRAAYLCFIVGTGARAGEIGRARPEHIDLKRGFVKLLGTKAARGTGGRKIIERHVPITALSESYVKRALADAEGGKGGAMFSAWANIWRELGNYCDVLGFPHTTRNDLRRTFSTWLQQHGVPNEVNAKMMGHRNVRMVEEVYGQAKPEDIKMSVERAIGTVGNLYGNAEKSGDKREGLCFKIPEKSCRPCGIRTRDQRIKSPRGVAGFPDKISRYRVTGANLGVQPEPRTFGELIDGALALTGTALRTLRGGQ